MGAMQSAGMSGVASLARATALWLGSIMASAGGPLEQALERTIKLSRPLGKSLRTRLFSSANKSPLVQVLD